MNAVLVFGDNLPWGKATLSTVLLKKQCENGSPAPIQQAGIVCSRVSGVSQPPSETLMDVTAVTPDAISNEVIIITSNTEKTSFILTPLIYYIPG